jgi:hypothetical protein
VYSQTDALKQPQWAIKRVRLQAYAFFAVR